MGRNQIQMSKNEVVLFESLQIKGMYFVKNFLLAAFPGGLKRTVQTAGLLKGTWTVFSTCLLG